MKKEKMNNKGFSLVELIIVIAIMAVLVVVLAPQYLKYVERSRNSTDLQNATAAVTACQVYAADPEATETFTAGDFTITITSDGNDAAVDGANKKAAAAALADAKIDVKSLKCKSKTTWASYEIKGTVQAGGDIKFSYESYETTDATGSDNGAFAKSMAGEKAAAAGESDE